MEDFVYKIGLALTVGVLAESKSSGKNWAHILGSGCFRILSNP